MNERPIDDSVTLTAAEEAWLREAEQEPWNAEDTELLDDLRDMFMAMDPPPSGLNERVQFDLAVAQLYAEEKMQAEVAELKQLEAPELPNLRAASVTQEEVRTMTFATEAVTFMITITPSGDGPGREMRVDGWLAGEAVVPERTVVEAMTSSGRHEQTINGTGRVMWSSLPAGLLRFVIRRSDPHVVIITPELKV